MPVNQYLIQSGFGSDTPAIQGPVIATGGAFYFVVNASDVLPATYKSLDGGVTWAFAGGISPPECNQNIAIEVLGTKVYVVTNNGAGFLLIDVFETTTHTWTHFLSTVSIGDCFQFTAFMRPDGTLMCGFQLTDGGSGLMRAFVVKFDPVGHTFGSAIPVGAVGIGNPDDWRLIQMVQGSAPFETQCLFVSGPLAASASVNLTLTLQNISDALPDTAVTVYMETAYYGAVNPAPCISCDGTINLLTMALNTNRLLVRCFVAPVASAIFAEADIFSSGTFVQIALPFQDSTSSTGQLIVTVDDLGDLYTYQNQFVTRVFEGNISTSSSVIAQNVLGPVAPGGTSAFIFEDFTIGVDQRIAFVVPAPTPPVTPSGPNPIISYQTLAVLVLPDPSILCSFQNKSKGPCTYVYDTHKSK